MLFVVACLKSCSSLEISMSSKPSSTGIVVDRFESQIDRLTGMEGCSFMSFNHSLELLSLRRRIESLQIYYKNF